MRPGDSHRLGERADEKHIPQVAEVNPETEKPSRRLSQPIQPLRRRAAGCRKASTDSAKLCHKLQEADPDSAEVSCRSQETAKGTAQPPRQFPKHEPESARPSRRTTEKRPGFWTTFRQLPEKTSEPRIVLWTLAGDLDGSWMALRTLVGDLDRSWMALRKLAGDLKGSWVVLRKLAGDLEGTWFVLRRPAGGPSELLDRAPATCGSTIQDPAPRLRHRRTETGRRQRSPARCVIGSGSKATITGTTTARRCSTSRLGNSWRATRWSKRPVFTHTRSTDEGFSSQR